MTEIIKKKVMYNGIGGPLGGRYPYGSQGPTSEWLMIGLGIGALILLALVFRK